MATAANLISGAYVPPQSSLTPSPPSYELRNALETLSILQELAERDISELKSRVQSRSADHARSRSVNSSEWT